MYHVLIDDGPLMGILYGHRAKTQLLKLYFIHDGPRLASVRYSYYFTGIDLHCIRVTSRSRKDRRHERISIRNDTLDTPADAVQPTTIETNTVKRSEMNNTQCASEKCEISAPGLESF